MQIIKIEKIWQGKLAFVRDYEVLKAWGKGKDIVIVFRDLKMKIPHKELLKFKSQSPLIKSKIGGKDYVLYDYPWKPNL